MSELHSSKKTRSVKLLLPLSARWLEWLILPQLVSSLPIPARPLISVETIGQTALAISATLLVPVAEITQGLRQSRGVVIASFLLDRARRRGGRWSGRGYGASSRWPA